MKTENIAGTITHVLPVEQPWAHVRYRKTDGEHASVMILKREYPDAYWPPVVGDVIGPPGLLGVLRVERPRGIGGDHAG